MPYSDRMQRGHLYSVFFAPRGLERMADLGMQVAQQYLSPFDKIIGIIGEAGSGKSMIIKGMFPGLELSNDDEGVNVRPLPLLSATEETTGFYTPHTYHVDIRFEAAFTQMHALADAIMDAVSIGKRVIVEHFDLIRPFLDRNAHLLIAIGEEVIITRPTLFGPEPSDLAEIVFKSIPFRRMIHSAEDLCSIHLLEQGIPESDYSHADVRHGFIFSFLEKPNADLYLLEQQINSDIERDVTISFLDDYHIMVGDLKHPCQAPRNHVRSAKEIGHVFLYKELLMEPITNRYLLVCVIGDEAETNIKDLNRIIAL